VPRNRWTSVARALTWLEGLASRRTGALVLFALGLSVYAVRALAWPLRTGRDLDEYLLAYAQLFDADVLLPWSMLFRTPVTPVVAGGFLDLWDGALAEPMSAVLFALSVVAWSAAGLALGSRVAIAVAAALLVYPGWGAMFHELSSETTFAAGFALWAWLVTRAAAKPSSLRFAAVGLGIALLALIRPGNAVLLVFAVFPFVLPGHWRQRIQWAAAVAAAAIVPLRAWSVHNGVRFDEYTLARGGNAIVPFYRAFITDTIVSPANGDASRRLAGAMQRRLLTREPYRSYGVTLDELFRDGSFRVHEDLYLLSDQAFGWDDDYAILRTAGIEGVRAHPGVYASGVLDTMWEGLSTPFFRVVESGDESPAAKPSETETVVVAGRALPRPTEGEPIPAGQVVWISRPDQSIRQVWTSPTDWHFEFLDPAQRPRFEEIVRERHFLSTAFPDRAWNATLGLRLNRLALVSTAVMWIVVGLVGIAVRRPRQSTP
jgi:hypothetical protein